VEEHGVRQIEISKGEHYHKRDGWADNDVSRSRDFIDDDPFRFKDFPEERTTTEPELPRISYVGSHDGSIATTSIGSRFDRRQLLLHKVLHSHSRLDSRLQRPPRLHTTRRSYPPQGSPPLPDIDVTSVIVRKRIVTPVGNGTGNLSIRSFSLDRTRGKSRDTELVLMAEEIKDVVTSTALWMTVREVMGSVGGDKRKADGWKLRG